MRRINTESKHFIRLGIDITMQDLQVEMTLESGTNGQKAYN